MKTEKGKKATYYISQRIVNILDRVWLDLRAMAPPDKRQHINKSKIVEAALEIALGDHQERGKESDLYYATVRKFLD